MNDIQNNIIPVVAGFQGMDENNNITTLGRGGSDTSAVALAAALNADVCEIYTDVSGVYSADPRLVPKAHKIDTISFEEMIEMASLGSKVLHIRCVEIAAKYKLKLHVRSSFDYLEGTMIVGDEDMKIESPVVTAITHEASTAVIRLNPIPGGTETLSKLFMELAEKQIIVDVISQSDHDQGQRLAFSVPVDEIKTCKQVAKNFFPDIEPAVMENVSKVSIVGVGMRSHPGVAARFFNALAKSNVPIHLVTTSEIKVSAIIDHENLEKAANVLHDTFEVKK